LAKPGGEKAVRPPKGKSGKSLATALDLSDSHAHLTGHVLDGRYAIEKKIGEGGMSFVYLARDAQTGQRDAIKVLSPALSRDKTAMQRLRREAEFGIRLAHPNVCNIKRLGETATGLVYVVMPYLEGEILADRTHRLRQLQLDEVVGFVREIAAGLQVAHELAIVHRDLKPENIMITRDADGRDHAVVMDFGLAKERRASAELAKLTAITPPAGDHHIEALLAAVHALEPAGAAALAALLYHHRPAPHERVVVVLSGGNVTDEVMLRALKTR